MPVTIPLDRAYDGITGGRADMVRALIAAGADVNAADDLGVSVLMAASSGGFEDVVKMLIKAKAEFMRGITGARRP